MLGVPRYLVTYGEDRLTVDAFSLHQACVVAIQRRRLMLRPTLINGPSPTRLVVEPSLIEPDESGRWYVYEAQDEPRICGTVERILGPGSPPPVDMPPADAVQIPCLDCGEDRGEGPANKRYCGKCRLRRRVEQRKRYQERLRGAG